MKITPFCGGLLATNAYLIETPDGKILIDAPDETAAWLRDELGIRPDHLLLTHLHFDHILGAADVLEHAAPGCKSFAFAEKTSPDLTLETAFNGFSGTAFEVKSFQIDTVLAGTPTLEVAGLTFEIIHVPGHSPDSICFYLPEEKRLFGGDVLMQGGVGRTDFPHGDAALLASGIRDKILPLGDDVRVYPGHGPETTVGNEQQTVKMLLGV